MAKSLPSRSDILQVLASEDRAFHAKELATRLGVDAHGYQGLVRQLDDITFEGLVTARDGHKFKLSRTSAGARGDHLYRLSVTREAHLIDVTTRCAMDHFNSSGRCHRRP